MINFLKKYRNQIIIIATIILIILITMQFKNLFGSYTDWINQHTIYPDYFRQLFYKTGNILPNLALNYGGGENIFNFSYYGLLSPLILPSYMFPYIDMTTYLTIINIFTLIATSLLFYSFLKKNSFNESISLTVTLLLTLSAPLIFQMHRHIMFVNYMPFLIMGLMGIDKFVKHNKKILLIVSVFLMIMTSYYYSVCGILVIGIYYLYSYSKNNKKIFFKSFIKNLFTLIGVVFIAILMSCIILLPIAYTLLIGRGNSEESINILSLFIPYLKFHKIFCGTYDIGLSVIGFISLIYLFFSRKRSNIIAAITTSIVLFIPVFRYLLNGGLYLREKCFIPFIPLISFFIAIFLKDLFTKKINIKHFTLYLLIIFGALYYFNQKEYCYLILIIFLILLFIYKKINKSWIINGYLIITALLICISENLNEELISIDSYNTIFNSNAEKSAIKNTLSNDLSFYRMNNLDYPTITINKIYDPRYLTTNLYSSTYNNYYLDFVHNNLQSEMIDYNYFMVSGDKNILFNSFMGVKYLYSSKDLGQGYINIGDNIYYNSLALPIIYATNNTVNLSTYEKYQYPYNIELLLNYTIIDSSNNTTAKSNIKEINLQYQLIKNDGVIIEKDNNGYNLKVNDEGYLTIKLNQPLTNKLLFIDLYGLEENSCSIDNIKIDINDISNILTCKTWIYKNENNTFHYLINDANLNTLNIVLTKGNYSITNIKTYELDYNELLTIKNNKTAMTEINYENDTITGVINNNEDGYLVTSIPYDDGFSIYIDGQKKDIIKVNKSFIGTKLSKGYHKIEIKYNSPWLNEAKIISLIGLLSFIIVVILEVRKSKNEKQNY